MNSVHPVGVFAQITSVFAAAASGSWKPDEQREEGLAALLYPHRQIQITELIEAGGANIKEAEKREQLQTVELPSTPPILPVQDKEVAGKFDHRRDHFLKIFCRPYSNRIPAQPQRLRHQRPEPPHPALLQRRPNTSARLCPRSCPSSRTSRI